MKRQLMFAIAVSIAFSTAASAATIFFDFGDSGQPSAPANNYNDIFMNAPAPLPILDAIDSSGNLTGIGVTASGFYAGSNTTGATTPAGAAGTIFATTPVGSATRDNAFGHAGVFGTNPLTPSANVDFTGLNPALSYNFTFFAARAGVTDNREAKYTVNGSTSAFALLDAAGNTSNVADVLSISPTPAGTINIHLEPGPNNAFVTSGGTSGSGFYYLGAIRVESVVPEPATLGLLLLAGMAFTLQRRSRS